MAFSLVCSLGNFCLPILKVIVSLRSMESPDEPWKAVGICVPILRIISFSPNFIGI